MKSTFCPNPLFIGDFKRFLDEFDYSEGFDPLILDEDNLQQFYRLEYLMQNLQVQGVDNYRSIWVEVCRGSIVEWCTFEQYQENGQGKTRTQWRRDWRMELPEPVIWMRLISRCYRLEHVIFIEGYPLRMTLSNTSSPHCVTGEPTPLDLSPILSKLGDYLEEVVYCIRKNPGSYNDYIKKHLPKRFRSGRILRSKRDALLPGDDLTGKFRYPQEALSVARRCLKKKKGGTCLDTMTLRDYIHYWRVAFLGMDAMVKDRQDDTSWAQGRSDREIFERSPKGREIEGYDLDSEEDFLKWENENSPYHCFDLIYVGVHLFPEKQKNGKWTLRLCALDNFIAESAGAAIALEKEGVPFIYQDAMNVVDIFRKDDYIEIYPDSHSARYEGMSYPWGGGVTKKILSQFDAAATWYREESVLPVSPICQDDEDG